MSKNTNLQQAKSAKADEFYTQLTDIEKELRHYKAHFKGALFLCNYFTLQKYKKNTIYTNLFNNFQAIVPFHLLPSIVNNFSMCYDYNAIYVQWHYD